MDTNIRERTGQDDPVPATTPPAQFVLVIQDSADGKTVEVAGVQRPEVFQPTSPAHMVGAFIQRELPNIIAVVQDEARMAALVAAGLIDPPAEKKLVETSSLILGAG